MNGPQQRSGGSWEASGPADAGETGETGEVGRSPGLLAKLMAVVRPQFRAEDLVFDPRDPVFGEAACAVSNCGRPQRDHGMCPWHRRRWLACGETDLEKFVASTTHSWNGQRALEPCVIIDCRYGRQRQRLCSRHAAQWDRAGRPGLIEWQASASPRPAPARLPDPCRIEDCVLWAHGTSLFCSSHNERWQSHSCPDMDAFIASCIDPGPAEEHIDLRRLPTQLRLEIAYVLQCRYDEATAKVRPAPVQVSVDALAGTGLSSLLERAEDFWARLPHGQRGFVVDAYHRIEVFAFGQGWDIEYPRPVWRLRNLGIDRPSSTVDFRGIPQPWLTTLAKRWARWQLTTGHGPTSARVGVGALTRFAGFLIRQPAAVDRLQDVTRCVLERYLAELHAQMGGRCCHRQHVSAIGSFLRAIRQHDWDHGALPTNAMLFPEDYPKRGELLPRALPPQVMAQVELPANLDRWDNPAHRLITVILMRTGLRISSAVSVAYDCIVFDADGAPYLRYSNTKMNGEALVPIDEELHRAIIAQQQRTLARFPAGCPLLFPRRTTNLDGRRPLPTTTYRDALKVWLSTCEIRDEHGQPVHLTPHQWRHTLGTTLINRDVPQHVVQKILDHDSPVMTAHYARLSDTTIRRHWEAARKVNTQGETVTVDPDGPLAEAAWAKHRLSHATQALPNGYCGLPLVKKCEHANACLTCPLFITTPDFLPQHREHHQQTLQIITAAQARGQTRMATMNQQVADNLERIITSLEAPAPGQATADAC